MLSLSVSSGTVLQHDYWLFVFSYALGRMIIILVPSLIAWLVGVVSKRPVISETEMFYASHDGDVMGPFEARQIASFVSSGSLREDVKLCKEGSEQWIEWKEILTSLRPALEQSNWRNWMTEQIAALRQNLKPSQSMNYRIFIPAIILALLFGALLHSWLGERYRVFAAGNGWVMKTDRWTGQTWKCYGSGNSWIPVQEAR